MKSSPGFWGWIKTKTVLAAKNSSILEQVAVIVNEGVSLLRAIQTLAGPSGANVWHLFTPLQVIIIVQRACIMSHILKNSLMS